MSIVKAELKKENIFICDICNKKRSIKERETLSVRIEDGSINRMNTCRHCREKENMEVKEDIIYNVLKTKEKYKPNKLVEELDRTVIGQDKTKKSLSIQIYNHLKRIVNTNNKNNILQKNNILLLGTTGSGKTFIIQELARIVDLPMVTVSATTLTSAGYAGADVESIISDLFLASRRNSHKTECGIVFIDEIDKKRSNKNAPNDVAGEIVQQSLLSMLERGKVSIPIVGNKPSPNIPNIEIDTSNILFIVGGAFDGIEEIVKRRTTTKKVIGFASTTERNKAKYSNKDLRKMINEKDLEEFGLIPEFIGRFPVLCNLDTLEEDDLVKILKSPKGLVEEMKLLLKMDNKKLSFTHKALELIAEYSLKNNLGARELRKIVLKVMDDILYNAPMEDKKNYRVTEKLVKEKLGIISEENNTELEVAITNC